MHRGKRLNLLFLIGAIALVTLWLAMFLGYEQFAAIIILGYLVILSWLIGERVFATRQTVVGIRRGQSDLLLKARDELALTRETSTAAAEELRREADRIAKSFNAVQKDVRLLRSTLLQMQREQHFLKERVVADGKTRQVTSLDTWEVAVQHSYQLWLASTPSVPVSWSSYLEILSSVLILRPQSVLLKHTEANEALLNGGAWGYLRMSGPWLSDCRAEWMGKAASEEGKVVAVASAADLNEVSWWLRHDGLRDREGPTYLALDLDGADRLSVAEMEGLAMSCGWSSWKKEGSVVVFELFH